MTLIELLALRSQWTDDATIYVARPWSCEADAKLITPSPDTTDPLINMGTQYDYFLETSIARDFIDDLVAASAPSAREICERLIRYAIDDA
jgi:hypothetical protein